MTIVYKKRAPGLKTGQEVIIANDDRTKRLLFHQRAKSKHGQKCVFENSSIEIRHDLIDPEISICSPSVLLNEEILASTIYVSELPNEQYAAKVKDWQMYRIVR